MNWKVFHGMNIVVETTLFKAIALLSIIFISCSGTETNTAASVASPDGNYVISLKIDRAKGLLYEVTYKNKKIVGTSKMGFKFSGRSDTLKKYEIEEIKRSEANSFWKPIYGERDEYQDWYKEALIKFKGSGVDYNLRFRAYNEGVAFRYEFKNGALSKIIQKELTEFSLPIGATAWVSSEAQGEIEKKLIAGIDSSVERPLLIQLRESLFTAIGEASLVDFARMKFKRKSNKTGTLVADLGGNVVLDSVVDKTPWRFVMAAEQPGRLLENNYLLLNLNEPNKIEDVSYIKPGKIIRELTLGTEAGLLCVDFAVEHNLQYIEFDAGWYGNEYDNASDATTVTVDPARSKEELDLHKVIAYAKSKGIGVILYVNRRALEKQLDDVLPLFKEWGVSGVKYGFVNVGSQKWTSWLHDAVRKAAENKLMVDVHDEYRPTGYSRTYPNLITQEGIRGDEESPENAVVINTIFTRMIAGAGDQTNCYFAPRVTEKMGSHASQLAKAICIYSPWQFLYWYDRPLNTKANAGGAGGSNKYILEVPELAWYDALPTVWDDTRVIGGYPGEYAIIARKKGDDWFLGALSGQVQKDVSISLDFLDKDKEYEATIYFDDENSESITKVGIEHRKVRRNDLIEHKLNINNGLAIKIMAL